MAFTSAFPVIKAPLTARTSCPIFIPSASTMPTRFRFAEEVRVNLPQTYDNKAENEKETQEGKGKGNAMAIAKTPITYLYPIVSNDYDEFLLHSAPLPHLKEKDMYLWQSAALRSPTLYDPELKGAEEEGDLFDDDVDVDEAWKKAAPPSAPIWAEMIYGSYGAKIGHRREYSEASSVSTLNDEEEAGEEDEAVEKTEDKEEMPSLVHSPKTPSSSGSLSPVSRAVTPSSPASEQVVVHQITDSPALKEEKLNSKPVIAYTCYDQHLNVDFNIKATANTPVSGCAAFFHAPLRLRTANVNPTDAGYLHARRKFFPPTRAARKEAGQKMISVLMRRVNAAAGKAESSGK